MSETTTVTLADFLLARIAEDEAMARAAGACEWRGSDNGYENGGEVGLKDGTVIVYDEGRPNTAEALHIARHDPARVLAECEARRRIVEMHATVHTCVEPGEGYPGVFSGDEAADWFNPCPTLDAIATIYADHPDFSDEWRPLDAEKAPAQP